MLFDTYAMAFDQNVSSLAFRCGYMKSASILDITSK